MILPTGEPLKAEGISLLKQFRNKLFWQIGYRAWI